MELVSAIWDTAVSALLDLSEEVEETFFVQVLKWKISHHKNPDD